VSGCVQVQMVVVWLSVMEVWKEVAKGISGLGGVDGGILKARMRRDRKYVDVLVRVGRL